MDIEQALNDFDSQIPIANNQAEQSEALQRSEEWHEKRRGKFTGSRIKELMTCSSRKQRDWDDPEKLLDFGDTAYNYIIERAIERHTGHVIPTASTWAMKWGIEHEEEAKAFIEERIGLAITDCDYEEIHTGLGASPDGYVFLDGLVKCAFEVKCPEKVYNHHKLMITPYNEKHPYFWQTQLEMMSLDVDSLLFASYHPYYPELTRGSWQTVRLSNIHKQAILIRYAIAEYLITWLLRFDFKLDLGAQMQLFRDNVNEDGNSPCLKNLEGFANSALKNYTL